MAGMTTLRFMARWNADEIRGGKAAVLMAVIQGARTWTEVVGATGLARTVVHKHLHQLRDERLVAFEDGADDQAGTSTTRTSLMTTVAPGYGEYVGRFGFHQRKRGKNRATTITDLSFVMIDQPDEHPSTVFVRFPHRLPAGITETCKDHRVRVSCFVYRVFANHMGGDANKEHVVCLEPEEHILAGLAKIGSK